MLGLVDCNNFYVSCERVFRPDLRHRPVVVLSNNDGCAIARSAEAKALGIAMGAPYFHFKSLVKSHGLIVLSSNFSLYGDFSARVMAVLKSLSPCLEIYSVDEAFVDAGKEIDPYTLGQALQGRVSQWIGIPTSIGFAATKVLAKVANHYAKRAPAHKGLYVLDTTQDIIKALGNLDVGEVWGVGYRLKRSLNQIGIHTALDLRRTDPLRLRYTFSVMVERIVHELNGVSCFPLETTDMPRQSIQVTRSFKTPLSTPEDLQARLFAFTQRAGEKLRAQKSACKTLTAYLTTGAFGSGPHHHQTSTFTFPQHLWDGPGLLAGTAAIFNTLYRSGTPYKKGGVFLRDLIPQDQVYPDLLVPNRRKFNDLSKTMDTLNTRFGSGTITFAACAGYAEIGNRAFQSPSYTTRWDEIRTVGDH